MARSSRSSKTVKSARRTVDLRFDQLKPRQRICACGGRYESLYVEEDRSIQIWVCLGCAQPKLLEYGNPSQERVREIHKIWRPYYQVEFQIDREGASNG